MPSFVRTNWTTNTSVGATDGDFVMLMASGSGNFTLQATDQHLGVEVLQVANGNDTLLGGSSDDVLIATSGTDFLSAGNGNDFFSVVNPSGQFSNFAFSTFDGGQGQDTISFSGYVPFAGTVSSVERIRLVPSTPSIPGTPIQGNAPAILDITETIADQFDVSLIEGSGSIWYTMEGTSFDASPIQISAGSTIDFEVYGTSGDDTIIGSSTTDYLYGDIGNDTISGGAGDDILEGDDGNDVLTGGAGNDIFAASYGNDTIMDFALGQDVIAVPDVVANYDMLKPFLSQVGADTVLRFPYGGVQHSLTIKNTQLSSLSQASFVASGGSSDDPGTASDDTYFGYDFTDVFDGLAGNDIIYAGAGGPDQIQGGAGNDTVILTGALQSPITGAPITNFSNSSLDGGAGTDTLTISAFGAPTQNTPPTYNVDLMNATLAGFEQLQFQANAGTRISAQIDIAQITNNLTMSVNGGNGADALVIFATSPGNITVPNLTRTNWSLDLTPTSSTSQFANSDTFVLLGLSGSQTLQANTNHSGIEYLFSAGGNGTLIGGNDTEFLNGGFDGVDQLHGGGGTDFLAVDGQFTGQGTYADDLFDGGTGTDYLAVTGNVTFAGTLTSVEGILLTPAATNPPPQTSTADAQLTIDAAHAAAFGANALLRGAGSVIVNGTSAGTINLSGWQFETAPITVTINGSTGNDTIKGTSHADALSGGDGDDRVYWDPADNPANISGGNGTDRLVLSTGVADPVGFDLYAHGFEYLERETLDTGNANSWSHISDVYTVGTNLKTEQFIYWDDATSSYIDLDEAGNQAFVQVVNARDAQELTTNQTISWDDGTSTFVDFDELANQNYTQILNAQDAQGHTLNQQISWDDGTSTFVTFDPLSSQNYDHIINFQNAQGQTANQQIFWDDGTNSFVQFDANGSQAYTQILNAQDAQNRTINQQVSWDDGTKSFVTFDALSNQNYTQITNFVDALSRLDNQLINYDDGSKTFIDYDELNSQAWNQHIIEYATDGTTILRDYLV